MTTLGALSQSWIAAEASLPLGWQLTGLMQFGGEWVAFSEGPGEADHLGPPWGPPPGGGVGQRVRLRPAPSGRRCRGSLSVDRAVDTQRILVMAVAR